MYKWMDFIGVFTMFFAGVYGSFSFYFANVRAKREHKKAMALQDVIYEKQLKAAETMLENALLAQKKIHDWKIGDDEEWRSN